MPKINSILLSDLIPGMISILLFVLLSELRGMEAGLFASVGFSILAMFFTYLKESGFVKFQLIDTFILFILGITSLISGDDMFIKFKPVIVEFMLAAILWNSTYRRKHYVLELSDRYVRGYRILKSNRIIRGKSLQFLIGLIILHIFAVFYSVFFMTTIEWGFLSSIVLYLLLIVFVVYGYYSDNYERKKSAYMEILPVVDERGTVTGKALREAMHFHPDKKLLHPVVHLHVFNRRGELFLQKRSENKDIQPGRWDTAVGGHIAWGETLEEGLYREAQEEIGLTEFMPSFHNSYIWETDIEREQVYVFTTVSEKQPEINPREISEGRFWTKEELVINMGKGFFTPNLEHELRMIRGIFS